MKSGVLTSNSAGNSGPGPESIVNFSPWSLSVAANVIDRKFLAKVQLGNGQTYEQTNSNHFKSAVANETLAPFVVSFSSRGPNPITKGVMIPDLSAPGVDILAAWSEATTVTGSPEDTRVIPYNIISGTSMSCPHASGAASYVKSFNPTWSPSAIKFWF